MTRYGDDIKSLVFGAVQFRSPTAKSRVRDWLYGQLQLIVSWKILANIPSNHGGVMWA